MPEDLRVYKKFFESVDSELFAFMDFIDLMNGKINRITNRLYPLLDGHKDLEDLHAKVLTLAVNADELERALRCLFSGGEDDEIPF